MQVKIGSGKVAEPDFQRNGLLPELPNVQMRSGLTILSNPILRGKSSENFSATLPESSARRRHWGQGFPLQARFDIKTLCLPTHEPTGDGVVSMPRQIFPGLRFWPKYEIFQEHTILFSHLAISVYRIWYCLFREHWTLSCDRWTQWDVPYLKFLGHRLRFES